MKNEVVDIIQTSQAGGLSVIPNHLQTRMSFGTTTLHFASQAAADRYAISQQIEKLENKRRRTRAETAYLPTLRLQLEALSSPVNILPDHLLSHVFELGSDYGRDVSFSYLISHVTSRWRRVAIQTPRLWSCLKISIPLPKTRNGSRWIQMLHRGGNCPLQLQLVWGGPRQMFDTIRSTIVPLVNRSSHVCISAAYDCLWHNSEIISFALTPTLVSLSLDGLIFLDDDIFSFRRLLEGLRTCPRLELLSLHSLLCGKHVAQFEQPTELIQLPCLSKITLLDTDQTSMYDIVSSICAPLSRLEITKAYTFRFPTLPRSPKVLMSLIHLRLTGFAFNIANILKFIVHMPSLEVLIVAKADVGLSPSATWTLPFSSKLNTVLFERCEQPLGIRSFIEALSPRGKTCGSVPDVQLNIKLRVIRCRFLGITSRRSLFAWLRTRVATLEWRENKV